MTTFVHCRRLRPSEPRDCTAVLEMRCAAGGRRAGAANLDRPAGLAPWPLRRGPLVRRRWSLVLITLLLAPAALIIAWTDEIYYLAGSTIKTFPRTLKIVLTCVAVVAAIAAVSDEEAFLGLVGLVLIGFVLGMSLKK